MVGLPQYRSFVAVAEELHFGRAAERLGVAQSAVSRDIGALEAHLRNALFRRTTRRVDLTEFGGRFYQRISQALADIDQAVRLARLESEGLTGRLSVAYMNFAIHGPLVGMIYDFKRRYADVAVELFNSNTDQTLRRLLDLRIDAGLIVGEPEIPGLRHRVVSREKLALVVAAGDPLAARATVRFTDLAGAPLVLGNRRNWRGYRETVERAFAEHGIAPNVAQEAWTSDVIFGLVELGAGATLYPAGAEARLPGGLVMRPLEESAPEILTSLAWHPENDSGPLKRFLEIAADQ